MPRFIRHNLAGWGNVPTQSCRVYQPQSLRELRDSINTPRALVEHARQAEQSDHTAPASIISRGMGRSYGDAALNNDADVVLHQQLDRMLAFDPDTGLLHAEAGVGFNTIIDTFLPRGWFLPVTPGTKFVTLGGAIAANVHGKNQHRDGSLAAHIHSLDLLTASGQTLTCSRETNAELFWATLGGMGLTGAIVSAAIKLMRVESAYMRVQYQKLAGLDALLDAMQHDDDSHRYSVAWIDCLAQGQALGRAVLMRGDHATLTDLPPAARAQPLQPPTKRNKNVPCYAPNIALNALTVKAFNALYYRGHRDQVRIVDFDSFFYPLDAVLHWNRLYGRRGFYQYQAVLPPHTSRPALHAMLEKLAASRRASFLAVLKKFGPGDEALLSFPMAGYTLALDVANTGSDAVALLHELDRIVVEHGGRVYLAKDACLTRASFDAMYDRVEQFRQVKARIDPHNRFASSLARRLNLLAAPTAESVSA